MVSHSNVLHNCAYINQGFQHTADSVSLSWLPHFHDMGLVEGIIQPVYVGMLGLLMPPASFLHRPFQWLEAITRHRVTHSGGPDFAYDLCVRKISPEQRRTLDLSSWSVAYNGAEPVRKETLQSFVQAFKDFGFRPEAFYPAYGLAEATLKVSGGSINEGPVCRDFDSRALEHNRAVEITAGSVGDTRTLVSSGRAGADTEILIVEPETLTRCAPGEVGEIWVSGPGLAQGYWNRPEQTQRTFNARLADYSKRPFLRTGDLGFFNGDQLFVTGRLKDLIIIRGRNHYPQDIEKTVEQCHRALRPNSGAAFSIDDGQERLVIVQELEHRRLAKPDEVIETICRAVAENHEVNAFAILIVRAGSVPKTSSGKIQRRACRSLFLDGRLEAVAEWRESRAPADEMLDPAQGAFESRDAVESWLAARLAIKLRLEPGDIDLRRPLAEYGLDSLMAVELMHSIEDGLGLVVPMADILRSPSISELAAKAMLQRASSQSDSKLAPSVEVVTEHPLSRGQQALWFLHEISPENAAYNIASAAKIRGHVDAASLDQALQSLITRHANLRSTFTSILGEPVQLIHDRAEICLDLTGVSGWSDAGLNRHLVEEANRPFDLERGPLLRLGLLTRSNDEHILLLVVHHIVADFWSLAVLIDELLLLYESEKDGRQPTLGPLTLQYADYVRWHEEMLAGAQGERLWSYWQKQLAGDLPALNLPADHPRPSFQTYNGASQSFTLSDELTLRLRLLGRGLGATLYMTLLAAFQTLLHRLSLQEDVTVGSLTSGRTHAGLAGLVGYFVNPIVLRADFSVDPSFEELLDQVRQTVLGAFDHQDYPFALLVRRLCPGRDVSSSPLFQAMFVLQKSHLLDGQALASFALGEDGAKLKLGSLDLESMRLDRRVAQFDLTLSVAEADLGLAASLEYNTDLFEPGTINRLVNHFINLLEAITSDPSQQVSALPLMDSKEVSQLLVNWNDTERDFPHGTCAHELFEAQAERRPDTVAVISEDRELTYRQLNKRANRVANYLRRLGIGPEARVAILMRPSVEMIVCVLAVLKAGGAYVPMDAALPDERLGFILEDCQAAAILTEQQFVGRLPRGVSKIVCLDEHHGLIAQQSAENPRSRVTPNNLAYVIYTSGSTGVPKGVMVEHRSLVNYIEAVSELYGFGSGDRLLQFTSLSFDVSGEDIFGSLTRGAALVLRSDLMMASASSFLHECRRHNLTVLNLPTAYWHELMTSTSSEEWESVEHLRLVIIGGERAMIDRLRLWQQITGRRVRLANEYGPTEATVASTAWELADGAPPVTLREVPIGRPLNNVRAYILDSRLQPVPVGVVGHLHIAGVNLARGYLERADLTAEKFIPDPLSHQPGTRLYETGDMARYLPDGTIEFAGRRDHQVKVRGFRIDLGEIESALSSHPLVRDTVVLAKDAASGARRLVGYVVPSDDSLSVSELRGFAKEKLPAYMIPSLVLLDSLPTTLAGKLDLRALPEPLQYGTESGEDAESLTGPVERELVRIWAEVLKLERLGTHSNFFELGGDSILSIQVVARARRAGLELSPKQIFEHPTIAELAAIVGTVSGEQAEQGAVTGEVPLLPVQQWFFEQQQPDAHHWNMALLLEACEGLKASLVEKALGRVLEHHDALRLRFSMTPEGWRQSVASPGGPTPFQVIDLSQATAAEKTVAFEKASAEAQASLNLTDGPIIRAVMFDMPGGEHARLLIIIHHLAVDAFSWSVLLEDFEAAYQQFEAGAPARLPRKTSSIKQWAERLYKSRQSLKQESSYWLALAEGDVPRIPVDCSNQPNLEGSARTVTVSLAVEQTRALLYDAPRAYRTQINDVLLTALAQAFARWTGQSSILVELEGHGREEFEGIDLSRTVGWLTSAYPVKLTLGGSFDSGGALRSVKEQLRDVPARGIGYGVLRYGNDEVAARLRRAFQPEVIFNYLGQLDSAFSGLSLLKPKRHRVGQTRSGRAKRSHLLEIDCGVVAGRLEVEWTYNEEMHRRNTIEDLAYSFVDALDSIIRHCQSREPGGPSPSDFPLAGIDRRKLEALLGSDKSVQDIYPLSPTQQGMLFHTLYASRSGMYIGQLGLTITGYLDRAALGQAWQEAMNRHAVLRSTVAWENLNAPIQIVHAGVRLPIVEEDLRGLSATEQRERITSFIEADRSLGFDLFSAPLMRLALIRLGEDLHQFIWSHHHLLLDGWSLSLLLTEVFQSYESIRQNRPAQLLHARPYRDYIAWLGRQDLASAERFWREWLKGFSAPTQLPTSQAESFSTFEAKTELRALSASLTERLRSVARRQHLTLNTVIQAAWAVLLSRYSRSPDVIFGATVSGRPPSLEGVENMIGLFINTLPMRVEVRPEESPLELMRRVQERQSEMREYEYSPLVDVQGWSEVPRGASLFDSILVFENYPLDIGSLKKDLSFDISEVRSVEETNYPLTLVIKPGDALLLEALYDRSRFETSTIKRLLSHFEVLLESFASGSEKLVWELNILPERERRQLVAEFNQSGVSYPCEASIAELFDIQSEQSSGQAAIVFGDEEVSYGELKSRANSLAHYLKKKGVGPESLVGVLIERSVEMVVALLGILKAGAAYVPLDPNYPKARLAFMLEDSALQVLVTTQDLDRCLPVSDAQLICLDRDRAQIAAGSQQDLSPTAYADNLAYVMYTSGSTGNPKGVAVTHRGVVRLVKGANYAQLGREEVFLQLAPLSFDASTFEIWGSLLNGGKLVLMPAQTLSLEEIGGQVRRHGVTTLWLTAPLFHQMVSENLEGLKGVKQLLAGGDVLSPAHVNLALAHSTDGRVINGYGPTENTTFTCCYVMSGGGCVEGSVPIGSPISNTSVYLLDPYLNPVPVGVTGELYAGGDGLARGYLNSADLTAERFIPDPVSGGVGRRLYSTGDLARYRADGNLEFLGRTDNQVKVRGHRIEMAEVETALLVYPAIKEAAVIASHDEAGGKRLLAYLVGKEGDSFSAGELRDYLCSKLPDYMVPSAFITLDRLPLTPSGKLDRRALPQSDGARPEFENQYVPPRTPVEEAVASIWAEVLGLDRVGVHDDFFELGGHSLLATKVISKTRYIFKIELPLQTLFERPTVENLSLAIIANEPKPGQAEKIALILKKVKGMSADERDRLLEEKRGSRRNHEKREAPAGTRHQ
jgi:amino acid adenylation domain-containing protein/non-ribosomal peptide synthase protein (TIGR01720 family)